MPDGVIVNMPPFVGGRYQMTAAETEETMTIVSVRIHVERAIGRIKTYHILDGNLDGNGNCLSEVQFCL